MKFSLSLLIASLPFLSCSLSAGDLVFYDMPDNLAVDPLPTASPQLVAVDGYPDTPDTLSMVAYLAKPDPLVHGPGPYPAVIVLHGSGGLWSSDNISNGMSSQFDDWEEQLTSKGYLCIFPDSFNPRGIAGNFQSRRPHHDPATDDALCSPNYERPKDVVATLQYLSSRNDVDINNTALIGFSHGAQTILNSVLDPSVQLETYEVSYYDLLPDTDDDNNNGDTLELIEQKTDLIVPSPVRIPDSIPFPKFCSIYYPGCGFFGYHGQSSSISAGRYMPDTRTRCLLFHGTEDSLLGVDEKSEELLADEGVFPLRGNLYPIKIVESSALQAQALGVTSPFLAHHIFYEAEHSFDGESILAPELWDTESESIDDKAKRLSRDETLKQLDFYLRTPQLTISEINNLDSEVNISWLAQDKLNYTLCTSHDLDTWDQEPFLGQGVEVSSQQELSEEGSIFTKLIYIPVEVPSAAPENSGFFLDYSSFDY